MRKEKSARSLELLDKYVFKMQIAPRPSTVYKNSSEDNKDQYFINIWKQELSLQASNYERVAIIYSNKM